MLSEHVRPDIFDAKEAAATRDGLGKALLELGESNSDVVVVCADLAESTRTLAFKEKYPHRFVEVGVAEQNLAAIASGLAAYGKIPFIASYATFSPGRNNEQIRTTISINNVPVKIAGMHAGVSVGPDGATHQALEDMALMRVQPNMTVISPCDSVEAQKATIASIGINGPVYIRFAREKSPLITLESAPFEIGKANLVWNGEKNDVAIIATGPLLFNALSAARELTKSGVGVQVLNAHTIKPLDGTAIRALAESCKGVVTVEEHQIAGGLGGAVAEFLASTHPVPIEFIGVHDQFGQSGEPKQLYEHYGMGISHIIEAVKRVIARKK